MPYSNCILDEINTNVCHLLGLIHILVLLLIIAAHHIVEPLLILEIPLNGLLYALLLKTEKPISKDWLFLSFLLLLRPEADTARIGS